MLNSVEEKLKQVEEALDPSSWSRCCIYRAPWCMVEYNKKAYRPSLVSLGPYHYGDEQLQGMEFHKYRALCCMLKRNCQYVFEYLHAVEEIEHEVRACYEDMPDDFPSDKFVEMLVVDSCFILEILLGNFFRKDFERLGYPKKDPVFSKAYITDGILRDIILLENQIPLFVLERLHGIKPKDQRQQSVLQLVINVYNPCWLTQRSIASEVTLLEQCILSSCSENNTGMRHCLDIFRQTLMYDTSRPKSPRMQHIVIDMHNEGSLGLQSNSKNHENSDPKGQLIPSATKLKETGVKFMMVENNFPFWNVEFENGNMKIPQIVIDDGSELTFLNLMAFEQSHVPPKEAHITSYIALLDKLVNSASDVAQLVEDNVIVHTLGSDEQVAEMINSLAKGIYFSVEDGCYAELYVKVNKYSNQKMNLWGAVLVRNYFSSPWPIIGLIAGALELMFSGKQAFGPQ